MKPAIRPWLRLLPDRWVVDACTLGPIGLIGRAPGTNGSAAGLAIYTCLFLPLGWAGQCLLTVCFLLAAVALCDEGERRMQRKDPGNMVLDEAAAIPLCFIGLQGWMAQTGHVWAYMLTGFCLFRFFDILKPLGISRLQDLRGGWGVVLDDTAAAIATNLTLQIGLLIGHQLLANAS